MAEPVPQFDHSRRSPLVAFLSFDDGLITHLGKARRGMRAGTDLSRVNLTEIVELSPPVEIEDIISGVPGRYRPYASARFESGGVLPPKTFVAVVDAVRRLSESSRSVLDRFSRDRRDRIRDLGRRTQESLAYQKEATATALAMAGFSRKELENWSPPSEVHEKPTSFLDGLESARMREDSMVVHDLMQVPGFELIKKVKFDAAIFENDDTRLTLILANRLPLEQQLGADLIYFNEKFGCFVIVQYKAMEKARSGDHVYRLPNQQLAEEIARMKRVLAELAKCEADISLNGFRMMPNPFFLKLCPRIQFDPDDRGLITGMYIPLDYWNILEADNSIIGSKGGRGITYQNVRRHLDNTGFIALVAGGWVGTTTTQSVIEEVLQSGRTVALAIKTDMREDHPELDEDRDDSAAAFFGERQ